MAGDSLGKKTHLHCALELFRQSNKVWSDPNPIELVDARRILSSDKRINNTFGSAGWPFDRRSQQAYVHRFFSWLQLPSDQQQIYPVKTLATGDSIAFRQCLWIDFVHGTPEAQRAIEGLYSILVANRTYEISPATHNQFCNWVGIPITDNTRRGPFARWLEDVGFAVPKPGRATNETSVIVDLCGKRYATAEAFIYGLMREFSDPFDGGGLRTIKIAKSKLKSCLTLKALFLAAGEVQDIVEKAKNLGYIAEAQGSLVVDPSKFNSSIAVNGPFPSQSWLDDTSDISTPIDRKNLDVLIDFPSDECVFDSGDPFVNEGQTETITRRVRDGAFRQRVASAYEYRCAITNFKFRSVSKMAWYGDAAHIVPHSGTDKDGNKVFGSSEISNGLFLHNFMHWCFDRGWLGIECEEKKGKEPEFICRVATVAVDSFFENEGETLLEYDGRSISRENLPFHSKQWPSKSALSWHMENIFDG